MVQALMAIKRTRVILRRSKITAIHRAACPPGADAAKRYKDLSMTRPDPSLLSKLGLACRSFLAILSQPGFAARIEALRDGATTPAPAAPQAGEPKPVAPVAPSQAQFREIPSEAAMQLLGLLQRDARFIDFIEEDVANYTDADIGAAARIVHEGCRKVLREHFSIQPLRTESEGSRITLAAGFDAAAVRLTGNVVGQAPFTGSLSHRGWRISEARLPRLAAGHDASIVAQAEVEL